MRDCNDEPNGQQFDCLTTLFKTECPQAGIVTFIVKRSLLFLLIGLFLTSCATSSIESRRRERAGSYATLSPEFQKLVDEGQIRRGMTSDAVYIAWGKPAQVLQQENHQGVVMTWLYHGGWLEETRYWTHTSRAPISDYQPRTYVSAEITFVNNIVDSWRTLPKPTY